MFVLPPVSQQLFLYTRGPRFREIVLWFTQDHKLLTLGLVITVGGRKGGTRRNSEEITCHWSHSRTGSQTQMDLASVIYVSTPVICLSIARNRELSNLTLEVTLKFIIILGDTKFINYLILISWNQLLLDIYFFKNSI